MKLILAFCLLVLATRANGAFKSVCEHKTLSISCNGDEVIKVNQAMYGRTKKKKCGENDNTNCRATSSLAKVSAECDGKIWCNVLASSDVFGEPCGGVSKYLDVSFSCVPQESVSESCPDDWIRKNDKCYMVSCQEGNKVSWYTAYSYCRSINGMLPEPKSEQENDDLVDLAKEFRGQHFWLGLNDITREKKWIWQSNGKEMNYRNFAEHQPDNYNNEDCGMLRFADYKWNDARCNLDCCFMCVYTGL